MPVPDQNPTPHASGPGPQPGFVGGAVPWHEALEVARLQARRLCGPRHRYLADDLAQESVIRLLKNSTRIRIGWRPFLSQIVANTARSWLQRETSRRLRVCPDTAAAEAAPAEEPGPLDQVVAGEAEARLGALLGELDGEFGSSTRAIVDLRAEGVPWEEIAGIVRLSDRACRYRHDKATEWLCKHLSLQMGEGRAP